MRGPRVTFKVMTAGDVRRWIRSLGEDIAEYKKENLSKSFPVIAHGKQFVRVYDKNTSRRWLMVEAEYDNLLTHKEL